MAVFLQIREPGFHNCATVPSNPTTSERIATPPLWLLLLVTISASISMHLLVPALPAAAEDLHVDARQTQMTISVYLLGLAAGQIFCGPLSDAWGRRRVLLAGLSLFSFGSIVSALAPDIHTLLAARVVQALGASAGMALGRAVIRDTTHGEEMVRQLALLGLMVVLSPGLAPVLGGVIAAGLGWRGIFAALASVGIAGLVLAWRRLPETNRNPRPLELRRVAVDYGRLLRSARFVGLTVGGGALTTSVFAFVASAPFIFTTQLGLPVAAVGICSGVVMLGLALGNALASALVFRLGSRRLMLTGLVLCCAAAALLLLVVGSGRLQLATFLTPMAFFTCGIGLAAPTLMAASMTTHPELAGSAAGLYGSSQMVMGTISTSIVGGADPAWSCVTALALMTLFSCACIAVALRSAPPASP